MTYCLLHCQPSQIALKIFFILNSDIHHVDADCSPDDGSIMHKFKLPVVVLVALNLIFILHRGSAL